MSKDPGVFLKAAGFQDAHDYDQVAFSRSIGILNANELDRLSRATVAVAGLGGVGGVHVITSARSGIGRFKVADFDVFDPVNVNRQYGAKVSSFGRSKLDYMVEQALDVNPFLEIEKFPAGVTPGNVDDFLKGVDVVLDGLDFFVFDIRRLLFTRALELGIPVITAGPMGFSSALLVFMPGGMGFDEYFDVNDDLPMIERYLHFASGLAPKPTHIRYMNLGAVSLEEKRGPSMGTACQLCSAMAGTEAVRIILGRKGVRSVPYYVQYDPYLRKLRSGTLRRGNRTFLQRTKIKIIKKFVLPRLSRLGAKPPETPQDVLANGELTRDAARYLVRAGIQAPSGDNIQPWTFATGPLSVDVHLDTVDQSFFNARQVASKISCGAAAENIRIAASSLGFDGRVAMLPEGKDSSCMARVSLESAPDIRESDLNDMIWRRCTNRKMFAKTPVDDGVWERFARTVKTVEGAQLHWVNTPEALKTLSSVIFRADRIRTEDRSLHEHLMKMTRFSHEEAGEAGDGFSIKNLEAGFAGERFLKLTRPWSVMRVANGVGLGRMVAQHSAQGIIRSGGCGLLTVDGASDRDFLKGGQALQRLWLTLTHWGLQFQPMTAVTLFRLRWMWEGDEAFASKHRQPLLDAWSDMDGLFPDSVGRAPVMLFRIGFGAPIRYGTYRKDVDDFLKS